MTSTILILSVTALFYLYSICSLFLFFVFQFFPATTKYNNNDKFVIYAVLNLITFCNNSFIISDPVVMIIFIFRDWLIVILVAVH